MVSNFGISSSRAPIFRFLGVKLQGCIPGEGLICDLECPRKLGSMVSKWVSYNLLINGVFLGVVTQ